MAAAARPGDAKRHSGAEVANLREGIEIASAPPAPT
jgi:hypothetical protein